MKVNCFIDLSEWPNSPNEGKLKKKVKDMRTELLP